MKKNLLSILAFVLGLGSLGAVALGGTNTKFVGSLPTSLSGSGITSSSVSIGVTSLTLKQTGQKLVIGDFGTTIYATIEPGNVSRQEFVSCTGITQNSNGSAILTTCSRGLSPVYPYTASTTMQFSHSGGATLIVSNSPPFYDTFANKNNDGTITGIFTYASTSLPVVAIDTTDAQLVASGTSTLATLNYVNGVAVAGASNATEAVKGIVELGTALETASSTVFGATGASTVMQTKNATDTPLSGCASGFTTTPGAGCSVIATLSGKIRQTWFNLAEAWTFTGGLSSTGTTTISASNINTNPIVLNGLAYTFPTLRGASSTIPIQDATGNIRFMDAGYGSPYNAYISMPTSTQKNIIASTTLATSGDLSGLSKYGEFVVWKYGNVYAHGDLTSGHTDGASIFLAKNGLSTTTCTIAASGLLQCGAIFSVIPGDTIAYWAQENGAFGNPVATGPFLLFATSTNGVPRTMVGRNSTFQN